MYSLFTDHNKAFELRQVINNAKVKHRDPNAIGAMPYFVFDSLEDALKLNRSVDEVFVKHREQAMFAIQHISLPHNKEYFIPQQCGDSLAFKVRQYGDWEKSNFSLTIRTRVTSESVCFLFTPVVLTSEIMLCLSKNGKPVFESTQCLIEPDKFKTRKNLAVRDPSTIFDLFRNAINLSVLNFITPFTRPLTIADLAVIDGTIDIA